MDYVSTCLRASVVYGPMCRRANLPKACQLLIFTCLRVIRCVIVLSWRANFSTWFSNIPKGVPIFQLLVVPNAKENFYTLLSYKKLYILLDIRVIHIYVYIYIYKYIYVCIVNKNCIIHYFYIHVILKKSV